MFSRILGITACITLLSGCVVVPEIKFAETMEFDFAAPSQQPIGYADMLCCFDCTV